MDIAILDYVGRRPQVAPESTIRSEIHLKLRYSHRIIWSDVPENMAIDSSILKAYSRAIIDFVGSTPQNRALFQLVVGIVIVISVGGSASKQYTEYRNNSPHARSNR